MNPGRIRLLQSMPIFGALRDDALECLLEHAPTVRRDAGEYYVREGDGAESMFVIEHGTVEVLKRWRGREWPLHRLHDGDCFGEMALMDYFARSASVRALEPCAAIEIAAAALHHLYEHDLEQFTLLQMNIGREVSRRLRATDELLFQLRQGVEGTVDAGPTLI